jgi:hypothetical protein
MSILALALQDRPKYNLAHLDGTCTLCVGRSCTGFLLSLAGAAAAVDEAPLPIVIGLPLFAVRACASQRCAERPCTARDQP